MRDEYAPHGRVEIGTWALPDGAARYAFAVRQSTTTNMTPDEIGMFPSQVPFAPSVQHLHRNGRLFPPNYLHDSWLDYLYWDTELEP